MKKKHTTCIKVDIIAVNSEAFREAIHHLNQFISPFEITCLGRYKIKSTETSAYVRKFIKRKEKKS